MGSSEKERKNDPITLEVEEYDTGNEQELAFSVTLVDSGIMDVQFKEEEEYFCVKNSTDSEEEEEETLSPIFIEASRNNSLYRERIRKITEEKDKKHVYINKSKEDEHAYDTSTEFITKIKPKDKKHQRKSSKNLLERGESEPGVPRPLVIWRTDSSCSFCIGCNRKFTFFLRKHHCRGCGHLFCAACSGWSFLLPPEYTLPHSEKLAEQEQIIPQRVCKGCFDKFHKYPFHSGKKKHRSLSNIDKKRIEKFYQDDEFDGNSFETLNGDSKNTDTGEKKHILIIAPGCFGDVYPYINLGKSLIDKGYKVSIASDENKKNMIISKGIQFELIPGDYTEIMNSIEKQIEDNNNLFKSQKLHKELINSYLNSWQSSILDIINLGDYSLIILTAMSLNLSITPLEYYKPNTPFIVSWLYPSIPTKYYAPPPFNSDSDSWFQIINKLKWSLYNMVSWKEYKEIINYKRLSLNLNPFLKNNILDIIINHMKIPCMNNWSPSVFSEPPDW